MIYIEGSIGSGKSSLAQLLADEFGYPVYLEDVNNGLLKGMLESFYSAGDESRKQVSAMLQVAFLTFRYSQLKKAMVQENAIMDSNLLSDNIMAKNLFDRGEMDESAYNVYIALNQEMQSNVNGSPWNGFPDLIIYLDISPEKEIEAINKRDRSMETQDPALIEYYHSVNDAYKRWYNGFSQAPVLRINRNKYDFVESEYDKQFVIGMIRDKMSQLGLM